MNLFKKRNELKNIENKHGYHTGNTMVLSFSPDLFSSHSVFTIHSWTSTEKKKAFALLFSLLECSSFR